MAKQLSYWELQSKNIQNLFVQACDLAVFEADNVKKYMQKHPACYR